MKLHRAAAALLVLAAGCQTVDSKPRNPLDANEWRSTKSRMYHDLALQFLRSEDHDRARKLLQQAVQYDPRDARSLELFARLSCAQGELEDAARAARMLQALDPDSTEAACTLGAVAEARNQWTDAETMYRRAAERRRADPRPLIDLHRMLLARGRTAEAGDVRTSLNERFPQVIEASLDHAAREAASRDWAAAASAYDQALATRPDDPVATTGKAVSSVLAGAPAEALAIGARLPPHAHDEQPSLARAIAIAHLQTGDCESALRELDVLARDGRPSASLRVLRGEILLQSRMGDAARAEFEQAIAQAPASARAHAGLGRALLALGRDHAAARAFEQALALQPAHAVNHALLAAALARTGDLDGAVPHAAQALRDEKARPLVDELQRQVPQLRDRLAEGR